MGAWRHRPGRVIYRMVSLMAFLWVLSLAGCLVLSYLAATALGLVPLPAGTEAAGRAVSLAALGIGVVGLSLGLRGLRRLLAPVESLITAAGKVESGDYSARVPEQRAGALRGLVRAFNSMSARLEEETARRRMFLADAAHELKTPLTVIRGRLEGIADGVYPAEAATLTPLLDEVDHLAHRIEDLQVLSLADAGALKLQPEPTSLSDLLTDVADSMQPQAEASGVKLLVQADAGLPLVPMDPARMRAAISNLLANSLRYTPHGGRVHLEAGADRSVSLASVRVRDTGRGIAADFLPHVFDRFAKSADSTGSGLGLAIAQDIVRAHGGEIHVQSRVGEGTEIRIDLPLGGD